MADLGSTLPEGFSVDSSPVQTNLGNQSPTNLGSQLPPGFSLDTTPTQPAQQPQESFLQKAGNAVQGVGNFLGLGSLGKGLANVAYNTFAPTGMLGPETKQMVDSVHNGTATPEQYKAYADIYGSTPSKGQVIGSAIQTGANVLSAGMGTEAATAGGRIASLGLQSAGIGAAGGFGQGLEQNKTVSQSAGQGALTGALTGVVGAGIQGAGELAKYLASSGLPESIINRTLGIPAKVVQKGKSPAGTILNDVGIASKKGLLNTSNQVINDTSQQISNALKGNGTMVDTAKILDTIKNKLTEVYGLVLSPEEIQKTVDKLPLNEITKNPQINVETLNNVRQVIDNQYIGNSKWLGTSTAESLTGLKTAANVMRGIVKGTVPETQPMFSKMADYITTRNALNANLSKPHVMTQLLEGIGSGLAGIVGGGGLNPSAIKDAAISFGLLKLFMSTPAKFAEAQAIRGVGKFAETGIAKGVGKVANIGAQQIIKKTIGQ